MLENAIWRGRLPRETITIYQHKKDKWILALTSSSIIKVNGGLRNVFDADYDSYGRKIWEKKYGHIVGYFSYYSNGLLYLYRDAQNRYTYFLGYKAGKPSTIRRADSTTDLATYDDNGWLKSYRDYRGYTTSYNYDSMGRVTQITPSKTQKNWANTYISYDFDDEVTQVVSRGSVEQTITYDNLLRTIKDKTYDDETENSTYLYFEYDEAGKKVLETFPSNLLSRREGIEYIYDGLGRLKLSRENISPYSEVEYSYLNGGRKQVVDPSNNVTTYQYDGFGALVKITQPLGVNTELKRNQWGQLTQLRQYGSQNGYWMDKSQYFYYDTRQRLCRHSTPEGGHTVYGYDNSGHMTSYAKGVASSSSCTAPSGNSKVRLTLDGLARVTKKDFVSSSTPDIYTSYDASGNVTTVNRGGANWSYGYDELNHLTSEQLDIDGRSYDQTYVYDNNEHLQYHTLPSGRQLRFYNTGLGQPRTVIADGNYLIEEIEYHSSGDMYAVHFDFDKHIYQRSYNARGQVQSIWAWDEDTGTNLRKTYSYDERGDMINIVDGLDSSQNRTFGYDALGRLEQATGPWGNGTYKYDALGNLRQKVLGSRTVNNYYYSGSNRIYRSIDSANENRYITHDSRGNVTRLGNQYFSYDYADQPTSIWGSVSGSYQYDGNMKRVKSVVDGKTIYNIYNKAGKLVHVDNVSDSKTTDYIRAGGANLVRITNGEETFLYPDQLGSAMAGVTYAGDVLWRQEYTPFGEKINSHAANDDLDGFTGHLHDSATGLTYMQARYYDPAIGRFLSIDPVGFKASIPGSFNRYTYVDNNPIESIDPDGKLLVNMLGGAALGGGVDFAKQMAKSMMSGQSFTDSLTSVDYRSVAASAAMGAITGGTSVLSATAFKTVLRESGSRMAAASATAAVAGTGGITAAQTKNSFEGKGALSSTEMKAAALGDAAKSLLGGSAVADKLVDVADIEGALEQEESYFEEEEEDEPQGAGGDG